jgi:hypothetical protein
MNTITHNHFAQSEEDGAAPAVGIRPVPAEDLANLTVRIAGSDDGDSIDALAARAGGSQRPSGALMLAAVNGRVLAAASMARHEAVSEPTPSGWAASAVVEYTLANLERRGRMARRAA